MPRRANSTGAGDASRAPPAARHRGGVQPVERVIRSRGGFLRRRDLLPLGYTDGHLRHALRTRRIFRVRQGWYSVPGADERVVRAVRVGGRLTSVSALETYGIPVPRRAALHIVVPANANRLRKPTDRRKRIGSRDAAIHWTANRAMPGSGRVPLAEALLAVLVTESCDVAVACCSAALQLRLIAEEKLVRVFARAPARVQGWLALVSDLDESHGETYFRVRYPGDECIQQVTIAGIGRFDFRVSAHVYVEIDGGQHDPDWTGGTGSTWEHDLDRDAAMAIRGDRVLHFGYRQLYTAFPTILAAIERAIADDAALAARRRRHPYRPCARRKRRRSTPKLPP